LTQEDQRVPQLQQQKMITTPLNQEYFANKLATNQKKLINTSGNALKESTGNLSLMNSKYMTHNSSALRASTGSSQNNELGEKRYYPPLPGSIRSRTTNFLPASQIG
jgi:hypothetical protein